tara:strand:- start:3975 stop:4799 length:825 start_codon:yes stop_codon:yes gene_type:complete
MEHRVLMADPNYFDVEYVINPHMAGHVGGVDRDLARAQWTQVKATYEDLGFPVAVIEPVPGLPDLVFTANQSFPGRLPDGRAAAVRSHMHAPQRRPEVDVVLEWHAARGTSIFDLADEPLAFEGMGDAMWVPGRRQILGGHGFRSEPGALTALAQRFEADLIAVRLIDPRWYHLDTCLQLLDAERALIVREAFDAPSLALLERTFPTLVDVPTDEALRLACNGHSPDGRHFIVQSGCPVTADRVRDLGLDVIEVDTSEFLKSGGSVFCMKLMLP